MMETCRLFLSVRKSSDCGRYKVAGRSWRDCNRFISAAQIAAAVVQHKAKKRPRLIYRPFRRTLRLI